MSGCGGNEDYEIYSSIKGYVFDYETGIPLEKATITLSPTGQTFLTDESGNFIFFNLDSRQYTIIVQKTGYQVNRKVISAVSGETADIAISLIKIPQ